MAETITIWQSNYLPIKIKKEKKKKKLVLLLLVPKLRDFRSVRQLQPTSIPYTKAFQIRKDVLTVKQDGATQKPS